MTLVARFTDGRGHDPACNGCPACSPALASLLRESSYANPPAWQREDLRIARLAREGKQMRVNIKPVAAVVRVHVHEVPPPPPLADRFKAASAKVDKPTSASGRKSTRSLAAWRGPHRLAVDADNPMPRVAASAQRVPPPPPLYDRIRAARAACGVA